MTRGTRYYAKAWAYHTSFSDAADGDLYVEDDLEVDGDVTASGGMVIGANGTRFLEIFEITGTTSTNHNYTDVDYPTGYTQENTRILSASITLASTYDNVYYHGDPGSGVEVYESGYYSNIELTHDNFSLRGQSYSIIVMKLP